jgi:hypothetical protein
MRRDINVRKKTNLLIDLAAQGVLSWEVLARECLRYMSERDVANMSEAFELDNDNDSDGDDSYVESFQDSDC